MADALILEFDGVDRDAYERVNEILGIDMDSGEGDWPAGLLVHTAGAKLGGWVVLEVWESQADQERFMAERLRRPPESRRLIGLRRTAWRDRVSPGRRRGASPAPRRRRGSRGRAGSGRR